MAMGIFNIEKIYNPNAAMAAIHHRNMGKTWGGRS